MTSAMERYQILESECICSWGSEEGFLEKEAFEMDLEGKIGRCCWHWEREEGNGCSRGKADT